MKLRTQIWNELRSPEIGEAAQAGALVVVPTGATEQHGAHLPVDTDILSATSVAMAAAKQVSDFPVLIAKVCHVGFSPECMQHPGTISLRLETFIALIEDVVRSIHANGFRKVMIVNGHGANIAPLRAVAWQLTCDGFGVALVTYWELIAEEQRRFLRGPIDHIRHACEFETSFMLHIRPSGVDSEAARDSTSPPWNPSLADDPLRRAGVFFPSVFRASGPGLVGAPTFSSAETGRLLFDSASSKLAEAFRSYHATDVGQ